jgi:hypothetical protein
MPAAENRGRHYFFPDHLSPNPDKIAHPGAIPCLSMLPD